MPSPTARHTLHIARERDLRRMIDQSVSRALFDAAYASQLLADPTLALGECGCTPQQRRDLRAIRARSVREFAEQARARFWIAPVDAECAHERPLSRAAM